MVKNVNRVPIAREFVLPQLHEMNLSQTLNTVVACRVCRGNGIHYTRNKQTGIVNKIKCLHCSGDRTMQNGDGK